VELTARHHAKNAGKRTALAGSTEIAFGVTRSKSAWPKASFVHNAVVKLLTRIAATSSNLSVRGVS
jgi:hypothetical protein